MHLDCPQCAAKLNSVDIDETGCCPRCGHKLPDEFQPAASRLERAPAARSDQVEPAAHPGLLWAVLLIAPSLLGMAVQNVFVGVALGFGLSLAIGMRSDNWPARIGITLLAFVAAIVLPVIVVFAGCMILMGHNKL